MKERKRTKKGNKKKRKKKKKKRGWFAEREEHGLAAKGIEVREKELEKYKYIYASFFFIAFVLAIVSFLEINVFAFVVALVTMFLSLVFYKGTVKKEKKEKKRKFFMYLLCWIVAFVLAILSFFAKNFFSLAISVFTMFLTSFSAMLIHKKIRREKIIAVVRELQRERRKTETDIDKLLLLLEKFKKLKISDIVLAFETSRKKAEEWCKILEEHGLASLQYPIMGEAELRIIETKLNEKTSKEKN